MHDPYVVAFEIRRPWPSRSGMPGRRLWWPPMVTVWHVEPRGRDSGAVCRHYDRASGKVLRGWRWHVWHWRIQVHPLQELRRRLLTRCEWCHGRHSPKDPVNLSMSWNKIESPWWRGERGLFHHDCGSVHEAHRTCLCDDPLLSQGNYGQCAFCGKFRSFGMTAETIERRRALSALPVGARQLPPEESVGVEHG